MAKFTHNLVNRETYPIKHVLVVEDIPSQQQRALTMLSELIDETDSVDIAVSVVPGGIQAWGVVQACLHGKIPINLIIVDHDMPHGDGPELIKACRDEGVQCPIITFSGIPENNKHLMSVGATHEFSKEEVIVGRAEKVICEILDIEVRHGTDRGRTS